MSLTGIVLTRVDGDGRGGAALSMRAVTGKPIKLIGTGEKLDALEDFHPDRIAGRILGMGDVVGLVEKAAQTIELEQGAEDRRQGCRRALSTSTTSPSSSSRCRSSAAWAACCGMLPGIGKIKKQIDTAKLDDSIFKRQQAIIGSMTPGAERKNPKLLNASRKKRVAAGSGTKRRRTSISWSRCTGRWPT